MFKILALNDHESDNETETEDEIQVTQEAEETIAYSEYVRALNFKSENKKQDALILFEELLQTRVLNEISFEDKENTLFCIRYNCHKNIAFIHEENNEEQLALEHYIKAIDLDDTEVYTMYRLGKLCLKLNNWGLAQDVFHKCLARNPNHWPSADGILQCLCNTSNIMGAYGWALKWFLKDPNYTRAEDVLIEITETFTDIIPFFEKVWKVPFKRKSPKTDEKKPSVFPIPNPEMIVMDTKMKKPNLDSFRLDSLSWLSVGKFIISVYNYCRETKHSILFLLNINDLYQNDHVPEKLDLDSKAEESIVNESSQHEMETENSSEETETVEKISESKSNDAKIQTLGLELSDSNAEDSDNSKIETSEAKSKPRRRCSDLSFLEQWGWHKNRRYSSRKKSQQDRTEVDNSLNAFLKRIFAKYFIDNFENQSSFMEDIKIDINAIKKSEENPSIIQQNYEQFQKKTEPIFQEFLEDLKSENFDLVLLIYKWLKYISKFWNQDVTSEITALYHEIYTFYLNHFDFATWNQLSNNAFNASYRMAVFYMELDHAQTILKFKSGNHEIDPQWKMIYHHLMFSSGTAFVISDENYKSNILRLIWIEYCLAKLENDLHKSVDSLQHLEFLLGNKDDYEPDYVLKLPNLKENNVIELASIHETRINLQRKISLNNVKNLYDNQNYKELVKILKESFVNSTEIKNSDNTTMKIQTQFEVLLESLWSLGTYDDCFIWSEKCLNYAVKNLLLAPTDTFRYEEWAESVNFIMIYVEELVLMDYEIFSSLGKYLSRLVQSLVKILIHQLDSPFDKNVNPNHPVNIKRPWVILHQILQKTEDNSPVVIKAKLTDLSQNEVEESLEDILPHTFVLLFTAHEFLGRRQWCTRDNGQLLLYTLESVLPKLRAPYMDACRDIIGEYLEQITYCLYGYPQKKARSRHIEEHDASPVEMTWKRAVQVFELYRPENLPEFNSYKLDSITADMEQLLLKIVSLIPKEIDPSSKISDIREFIQGHREQLPQGCDLLPQRVSCIYYLLADYYFKNRDFQRTIKYYLLDLTCEPTRFDSWAGIALAKASKLETKFNSCIEIDYKDCLTECENALRCFEECIKIDCDHTLLWIEYGSFAYTIHSYSSRHLKHLSSTMTSEEITFVRTYKDKFLKISSDCFVVANKTIKNKKDASQQNDESKNVNDEDDDESHDEKWLHHFMLGKIAEKHKENPKIYLDHYLLASNLLFENNATYPIKINHNNPQTLSIEALEIFYRTSSSIIKYLENNKVIKREIGKLFIKVLKDLGGSSFSLNQAKIDDSSINALKRKLAVEKQVESKQQKLDTESAQTDPTVVPISETETVNEEIKTTKTPPEMSLMETNESTVAPPPVISISSIEKLKEKSKPDAKLSTKSRSLTPNIIAELKQEDKSPSRRGSQESSATTTTTTTGTTGATSTTSSSSDSDSSSSADSSSGSSDSGNSSSDEDNQNEDKPFTISQLEPIYQKCIKNLEECVTRFPEHYKSIYRLIYHYLNAPEKLRNIEKCRQLLIGTYKTTLGNQITGLFAERKNNNFFNGIWRIPSSEIDRPGSFEGHLIKCVHILLEVLKMSEDHQLLIEIAIQLSRTPDSDKRYINDIDRKELYDKAIKFCVHAMQEILKRNAENGINDDEILNLILDIYRAYKKCLKHMNQKEPIFKQILVDAYKFYIQDKVEKIPENVNLLELAMKLCVQEISSKKNLEKQQLQNPIMTTTNLPGIVDEQVIRNTTNRPEQPASTEGATLATTSVKPPVQIPGISNRPRGRPVGSKNVNSNTNNNSAANLFQNYAAGMGLIDPASLATLYSLYNNPTLGPQLSKDPKYISNFFSEYYKILGNQSAIPQSVSPAPITTIKNAGSSTSSVLQPVKQPASSTTSTSTSSYKIPQFDIKNLIANAASQVAQTANQQSQSATISIGNSQLTITPTKSSSFIKENPGSRSNSPKVNSTAKLPSALSVTKVSSSSNVGAISVKPLSDLTGPKPQSISNRPNLANLPKSLTITPSTSGSNDKPSKSYSSSKSTNMPNPNKYNTSGGKIKASKKSSTNPYAALKSNNLTSADIDNIFALAAANQQSLLNPSAGNNSNKNFNLPNYNQQVNLLKSYADMLGVNSTNMQLLSQIAKFPMPPTLAQQQQQQSGEPPKRSYKKRSQNPKNLPSTSQALFNNPTLASIYPQSTSSPSPQFAGLPAIKKNTISPLPSPQSSSSTMVISPTKTLQQKLAEKQKANQIIESTTAAKSNSGQSDKETQRITEVIILD